MAESVASVDPFFSRKMCSEAARGGVFLDSLNVLAKLRSMSIATESSEVKSRIAALESFSKELRGYL